jgi:tetratricopeptide (TPR) repeat protein
MAAIQIFLSAASAEFETYRDALQGHLTTRGRSVVIQEGFAASGTPTLDKLAGYIASCDVVVHLIGDLAGAMAKARSVKALRDLCPDLGARFPELLPFLRRGGPALSYTQWEAWLALYHDKPVIVAAPGAGAPRGPRYAKPSEADQASQASHLALLASQECHVEIRFDSVELLAIELHKALAVVPRGLARPCDLPPAADRFVGRAEALVDLVDRLRAGQNAAVVGAAGFGKTALAAVALRQIVGDDGERLASSPWPDGVVLLDLYVHRGQAEPAHHALANRIKGVDFLPDQSGSVRAAQALRDQRVLVVVEGAEQCDGLEGRAALLDLQRPLGSSCRWLILTRLLTQADSAYRVWLRERLSDGEAGELLDELTRARPLPADLREPVLELLQGHPLALTWAGKLMARGDEDPRWLLREWRAGQLPSLADPREGRHTLAWLFDRSVSRLDDTARAVLSVAGCLAPTPVPLAAFAAALGQEEGVLRAGLRSLVQHGLIRVSSEPGHWQFAHVLAHGHARERYPAPEQVPVALATWLMQALQASLGETGLTPDAGSVAACLEHAGALLKGDIRRQLWRMLVVSLLYEVCDRLLALGWSAQVEADLTAVALGLEAVRSNLASDPEIERERSVLASRKADLFVLRGDLAGAEQAYRASLAVAEQLAKADPNNTQWQRDLSVSQNNIGRVLRAQGELAGAEQAYRASLAVAERLAKADPSNAQRQRDLSVSHDNIGQVLSAQGDLAGAEQAYRASLAVAERLARADPSNAQWRRDLSVSQNNIGHVLSAQGDLAAAEQAYRASLEVAERLAKADPSNTEWQRDMSISQDNIGRVLSAQGDLAGAEQAYRASLTVAEQLAKADPSNAQWQRDLGVSQNNIGQVLSAQGDLAGAEQAYRASLAVAERLAKTDPSNAEWQRDLSVSQDNIGQVLSTQGDLIGAEQAYRASLVVRERLAKGDPSNAQWQRDLSISQDNNGRVLSAQGDLAGAEQAYRASLAVAERLAKADPSNTDWQRDLSYSLTLIAELLERTGAKADALEMAKRSLAIDERLAALEPRNATWQNDVKATRAIVRRLGG